LFLFGQHLQQVSPSHQRVLQLVSLLRADSSLFSLNSCSVTGEGNITQQFLILTKIIFKLNCLSQRFKFSYVGKKLYIKTWFGLLPQGLKLEKLGSSNRMFEMPFSGTSLYTSLLSQHLTPSADTCRANSTCKYSDHSLQQR